jgi:DNA-binding transcriptional ArsR family regulator
MPAMTESSASSEIKVAPSAVFELMWLMHNSEATHPLLGPYASQEPIRNRFGEAARAFWADGVRGYTDLVVLAQRSGTLFDLELDRFFQRFGDASKDESPAPSMLSETPPERKAFAERLRKLRTDPEVRARYVDLLESVWAEVHGEWESAGCAAVVTEAARWTQRLREGAGFRELLQRQQMWKGRPQLDDLSDAAATDGRLVLSPGWFFGEIHIVELDGTVYLGRGIQPHDDAEDRRVMAYHVSSALKALADPTRVAILLGLAHEPASVTEVARQLMLSQPTVSGHVHLLREAGLLEEKTAGRSAKLSASAELLRRFFSDAQDSLLKMFH